MNLPPEITKTLQLIAEGEAVAAIEIDPNEFHLIGQGISEMDDNEIFTLSNHQAAGVMVLIANHLLRLKLAAQLRSLPSAPIAHGDLLVLHPLLGQSSAQPEQHSSPPETPPPPTTTPAS